MTTLTLITEEAIAVAERVAEEASRERQAVERKLSGGEYRDDVAERMADAGARARHAAVTALRLREQRDQQQAAITARAHAATALEAELPAMEATLTEARDAVVSALTAAEAAMVAAVLAAERYEKAIADTDATLIARGLQSADALGEHATGGTGRGQVRLSGRWWVSVPPAALLARSIAAVGEAVFPHRHPIGTWARGYLRGYSAARWSDLVAELDQRPPRVARRREAV